MLVWTGPLVLSYGMNGDGQNSLDHSLGSPCEAVVGFHTWSSFDFFFPNPVDREREDWERRLGKGGCWISSLHNTQFKSILGIKRKYW